MNETHFSMVLVNHFQPQAALPCLPKDHYLKYKLNNQVIYIATIITDWHTKKEKIQFITSGSEIKSKEWFEVGQ